jgi:hypothetical protein
MPIRITVPRLGWSMEEGTFSEWLKHDGDSVVAGDLLFVLESDKASQEVESLDGCAPHPQRRTKTRRQGDCELLATCWRGRGYSG